MATSTNVQQLGRLHANSRFVLNGTPFVKISSETPTYDMSGKAEVRNSLTDEVIQLDNQEVVFVTL